MLVFADPKVVKHEGGAVHGCARHPTAAVAAAPTAGGLAHADPEEVRYWKEVEQEELIVEEGGDDSSDDEQQQDEEEDGQ